MGLFGIIFRLRAVQQELCGHLFANSAVQIPFQPSLSALTWAWGAVPVHQAC